MSIGKYFTRKIPEPGKKKKPPPSLPVSSLGFRNAHVVLIKQDSEICWVKIKCIVFHKYQNANSL